MEATPKSVNFDLIQEDLESVSHVAHVHDLRIW